jgi:hypothetical protein
MSSSPVPVVPPPEPPQPLTLVCANCGAALDGEYCAACGQRHEPHLHTVAHFAAEGFESISHADSRLWRTLWYLVSRPGFLTREFFEGKRVRYLPPFRLYLVVSVAFFLIVGLPDGAIIELDGVTPTGAIAAAKPVAKRLEQDGGPASAALEQPAGAMRPRTESDGTAPDPEKPFPQGGKVLADQKGIAEFCEEFKRPDPSANKNYARLQAACAKIAEDKGASLGKAVVQNIPKAMFVFLPLLALGMKPLYWRPKRYYVEHLLFLIHNHAFVFLVLAILAGLEQIRFLRDNLGPLEFAVWIYIVWYLYRGMRNVYQQHRAITVAKYLAVGFFYFCAAVTVLLLTALFSAMTTS